MIVYDVKSALRGIRRDPAYAATVVVTLAVTLGAATAIFSMVNGVLLRPLPYRDPAGLVSIREIVLNWAQQYPTLPANARHFDEWRTRATSFHSLAALDWRTTSLSGAGEPFQATVLRASGTLFDVLQTPIVVGRPLARDDERLDRPRVTVITDALWRERFGGSPSVLGRTLSVGGTEYTIVGVLPPRFEVPSFDVLGESASLRSNFVAVVPFRLDLTTVGWMGSFNYPVIARLKDGVGLQQARAELDVLQRAVAVIASRDARENVELRGRIVALDETIAGPARRGLVLLLAAIAGVVLIACANLASLSLARTLGRMRDAAVRTALGADRRRLIRTVVFEQLLLAVAGSACGMLVARAALNAFVTAPIPLPRANDVVIDGRVFAFAGAAAIASGLAVALLPALRIGRGDLRGVLRGGGHGSTDRAGVGARAVLLGVQVALSVTLLAVTGLFVTSFLRLLNVEPGFSTERVVSVEMAPVAVRYPDTDARAQLYDRIADRARQLPGIAAVAWTSRLPLTGETWVDAIARPDAPLEGERPQANYRFVGPDYFRVLSIPILKGRSIEDRDRTSPVTPAVISARAAQTLWPGGDPLGQIFTRGDPDVRYQVAGVVVDGHPTALDTESPLMVYVPYWHNNEGKSILLASTTGDPAGAIGALRTVIRSVDPDIAIGDARPLSDVVEDALGGRRHQMTLFVGFGFVALLIATIGVYATTTYAVSRRRREMNIRVALGAPVPRVVISVLRQTLTPVVAGIIAGTGGALALANVVAGFLFEVRPRDPVIVLGAVLVVAAAGAGAAAIAARQGVRIDPVEALRAD